MTTFKDIQNELQTNDLGSFLTLEIVSELINKRKESGISQRHLSTLSGVPQKTISRIENGLDLPKINTLSKLIQALGYTISFSLEKNNESVV